jgi:polyisoprenoid-binding protein YceI
MSTTTVAANTLPETGVWNIDSIHSSVSFSVRHHAVAHFRSGFTSITGQYNAGEGRLAGEVQVADLDLHVERLKDHLLSAAFFNAEEFPTFSFASTSISPSGDEFTLAGDLTLHGITKPITATGSVRGPQTVRHGDGHVSERLGIDLSTTIERRDWGLDFNNELAEGIVNLGWNVRIEAALELVLS